MSERITCRLYRGPDAARFRQVFSDVVTENGGAVEWSNAAAEGDERILVSHRADVHLVLTAYTGLDYLLCLRVGQVLACPWLESRIQEGALWDYSLYHGAGHLHSFSTLPEYWDEGSEYDAKQRGDAAELSRVWGVPETRIQAFLRPWEFVRAGADTLNVVTRGKAYPEDASGYGCIWQMLDFLRALGAEWPEPPAGFVHRLRWPRESALLAAVGPGS
ncbi:MAG: hypothetical protein HZA54_06210 [Planctomycetes bacterium]|nr:hypothetical protein [Planctomycetota bacterium]